MLQLLRVLVCTGVKYHTWYQYSVLLYFFPEVFFHFRVIGFCPVSTDWTFGDEKNNSWIPSVYGMI